MASTSLKGRERQAPLAMDAERFRALGRALDQRMRAHVAAPE
jgi:hypothetical protein